MAAVRAYVYTDPACPWSWAAEPARRRLEVEFGAGLELVPVMGGLARELDEPAEALRGWIEAAAASGMPVDPRLWLDAAPRSSYPACLGVKAAREQGLDGAYLRRAREGFAFERRSLDAPETLVALARTVSGLDAERFRRDLASSAIVEAFGADLERTRAAAPERRGSDPRVAFPSLQVCGPAGERWAYGTWDAEAWREAALGAGAEPAGEPPPDPLGALRRLGALGTPEVAAVCALPGPLAPAELWRLAAAWRVRVRRLPSGELWELA